MDTKKIQPYIDILNENNLTALKIKDGDFEISLERQPQVASFVGAPTATVIEPQQNAPTGSVATQNTQSDGTIVTSPIIGTFYAAPSPDKPPFVEVGKTVKKGDVLFIIESMKLMNEIVSEFDGTVTDIMVQNSDAVEFGTPILSIKQ